MDVIASLLGRLGWQTDNRPLEEFRAKVDKADKDVSNLGKRLDSTIQIASRFGAGLAKAAGVAVGAIAGIGGATLKATMEWSAGADEIAKTAKKFSVPVEQLQRLRFAAERSGVPIEALSAAFKDMNTKIQEGRAGGSGSPLAKLSKELGLSLEELNRMQPEQRLGAIADALNSIEDPGLRAAAATKFLGEEAGIQMGPLLAEGSAGMKALGDEAERLGMVMSEETTAKAEALQDRLTNLQGRVTGVKNEILEAMVPALVDAADRSEAWIGQNDKLIKQDLPAALGEITTALLAITEAAAKVVVGFGLMIQKGREFGTSAGKWWQEETAIFREMGGTETAEDRESLARDRKLAKFRFRVQRGIGTDEDRERLAELERGYDRDEYEHTDEFKPENVLKRNNRNAMAQTRAAELQALLHFRNAEAAKRNEAATKAERDKADKARAARNRRLLAAMGGGGGGAGGGATGPSKEALTQLRELGLEDEIRRLGENYGASSKAIDAALQAAGESLDKGASSGVARTGALGVLSSMTGQAIDGSAGHGMLEAMLGGSISGASTGAGGGESAVSGAKFVRIDASSQIDVQVHVTPGPGMDEVALAKAAGDAVAKELEPVWRQIEDHFSEILES